MLEYIKKITDELEIDKKAEKIKSFRDSFNKKEKLFLDDINNKKKNISLEVAKIEKDNSSLEDEITELKLKFSNAVIANDYNTANNLKAKIADASSRFHSNNEFIQTLKNHAFAGDVKLYLEMEAAYSDLKAELDSQASEFRSIHNEAKEFIQELKKLDETIYNYSQRGSLGNELSQKDDENKRRISHFEFMYGEICLEGAGSLTADQAKERFIDIFDGNLSKKLDVPGVPNPLKNIMK